MADGNCSSIQPPFTVLTVIRPSPPSSIFNDKHFIFILFLRFGDFLKIHHEFARKYWAVCEKGSNMERCLRDTGELICASVSVMMLETFGD